MIKFNMNNYVWFEPTKLGEKVYKDYFTQLGFEEPHNKLEIVDGKAKLQFHKFINIYGDYITSYICKDGEAFKHYEFYIDEEVIVKNNSVPCADEVKTSSIEISNIIENWNGNQTFKVENVKGNNIKLPYGKIELDVEQGGWCSNYRVDVTWTVDYHRPDLELYRYDTCSSLEEALDWYKKQDLEASN